MTTESFIDLCTDAASDTSDAALSIVVQNAIDWLASNQPDADACRAAADLFVTARRHAIPGAPECMLMRSK